MTQAYIFSLLFFVTSALYVAFGLYIFSINAKSSLNRLFSLSCIALAIWAFCFSMANSAPEYSRALFWRRMTSLGWGTVYSFMLHFFLTFTAHKSLGKRAWLHPALYIPALINVYAFGLSDGSNEQYQLQLTPMGWINTLTGGWGDHYFNLYYVIFTLTGVYVVWRWGRAVPDRTKKKQAMLFIATFSVAMVLGSLTDVIVNNYTAFKVPQMAPVFILLPITAMLGAIKRFGLLGAAKNDRAEPGKILSQSNLDQFITIMSFVFFISGFVNFLGQKYFNTYPPALSSILTVSACFWGTGIALILLKTWVMKDSIKESIFVTVMLLSILFVTINFIDSASITVWAAPVIVLVLSVLFSRRYLIIWTGILILMTQIFVWIKKPYAVLQVDGSDYLARIIILGITFWFTYYVNRVYVKRLKENEEQVSFQKLVSQISGEFVTITELNLEEKINEMLELSGKHFHVDRTLFIRLNETQDVYEWSNEDIDSALADIPMVREDAFPWWTNELAKADIVNISSHEMLPQEASAEKQLLLAHDTKSMISIVVKNKGKVLGLLIFSAIRKPTVFGKDQQELLKILANILSDALIKVTSELEIRYMAYYDALTGLPNHTLFKERLKHAIPHAKRTGKLIGVLFIDLDAFKAVNDTIGHLGGDDMLRQIAGRLTENLRACDTVSRFGGDEFLILLTEIEHIDDIQKIAEKLILAIAEPITIKGQEHFVTGSVGIAVYPFDGEETEELIKHADLAMYSAKQKGKNQFVMCSAEMKAEVLQNTKLSNMLYRAMEKKELFLHYQPQVNAMTQEIVGVEALLRWNNPDYGLVSPSVFIPLAEQTGLINPIGKWVLETACRQLKSWQEAGLPALRVAVNLSVDQFRNRELSVMIQRILKETGLDSKYLELEITEGIAIEGNDHVISELRKLQALGISIAIDDFGTEYSSLNRIKTLPVDRIKIDMQFVHSISGGTKDRAIAKTIIQMAKNLELKVIAEGVETEEQYEFFSRHQCDEIQGFYFYKPMLPEEVEEMLKEVDQILAT